MGQTNQMTQFAIAMFGAIVSSVAVSTVIIMSLLGGPAADAMTAQNNNVQSGVGVNMCLDTSAPAESEEDAPHAVMGVHAPAAKGGHMLTPVKLAGHGYLVGGISGSFNTTNHNTTTTTTTNTYNSTKNTTIVTIKDNGNSYSANWNNGNTNNQAWNNGNTNDSGNTNNQTWNQDNNSNQGNNYSNNQSTSTTTSTTTNTTSVNVQDNGNTNNQTWNQDNNSNQNNGGNNNGNNSSSQNNGNTNNQNNGNNNGVIVEDVEVEIEIGD